MKKLSILLIVIIGIGIVIYTGSIFSQKSVGSTENSSPYQPITMRRGVMVNIESTTLWKGQGKNGVLLQRSRFQPHVWAVKDGILVDQPEVLLISSSRPSTGLNLAGVDEIIFNRTSGNIVIAGYENIKDDKPFNNVLTVVNPAGDTLVSYSYEQLAKHGLPTSYILPLVLTDDGSVLYVKAFTGKRVGELCDQHGLYAVTIPALTVTKFYQTPGCSASHDPITDEAVENIVTVVPSLNIAIMTRGVEGTPLLKLDLASKKTSPLLDATTAGVSWTYPDGRFLSGTTLLLDNDTVATPKSAAHMSGFHGLDIATGVLTHYIEQEGDVLGWTPDGKDVLWRVFDQPESANEAYMLYSLDPVTKKTTRIYRHENQDRTGKDPKVLVEDLIGIVL